MSLSTQNMHSCASVETDASDRGWRDILKPALHEESCARKGYTDAQIASPECTIRFAEPGNALQSINDIAMPRVESRIDNKLQSRCVLLRAPHSFVHLCQQPDARQKPIPIAWLHLSTLGCSNLKTILMRPLMQKRTDYQQFEDHLDAAIWRPYCCRSR